ncbi:MAG: PEP-utilizing enzyme [archaeon]
MAKNEELVGINTAAEQLGISKKTLRNWDNSGTLKAVRIGNRGDRRYKKEDINKLLNKEKCPEIDKEFFWNWVKHNDFWFQELPGLPITAELGIKEGAKMENWFKPGVTFYPHLSENDFIIQSLSLSESIENCRAQFEAVNKNPKKIENFFKEWAKRSKKFETAMTRLEFIRLKELSTEELLKEFNLFNKPLIEFWNINLLVESHDPFTDLYYLDFEKKASDKKKARHAFSLLTLPTKSSFTAEERKSLLNMIIKYLNNNKKRKKIMNDSNEDFLTYIKINEPKFFEALLKHQREFFWVQNNYLDRTILQVTDFLNILRDSIKESTIEQARQELDKITNFDALKKEQEELIKELKIPEKVVKELEYIKNITWIKDDRKRVILIYLHNIHGFIEEFARRTGINEKLIGYAKTEEIPLILQNSMPISTLQQRRNGCSFISQKPNKFSILVGNEFLEFKKLVSKNIETKTVYEIEGNVACRGSEPIIRGKVKVILNPNKETISEDEILVTSMTRPDFVPLMRKARAVITDEGGITCHAAIVSREMNKPCIIGTKNATKVLQSGQEIEIRMHHGLIKVIK